MTLAERPTVADARAALAAEWGRADPTTPEEIAAFYRDAAGIAADLDAWHRTPERQRWTAIVRHVARETRARDVLDVGCGGGHDLAALAEDGLRDGLMGVEPNEVLRRRAEFAGVPVWADVADAPVDAADLLLCLDVLEHVPDPEAWLHSWAGRVRVGAVLVEATATHDLGTPLHLAANRGWHPGRCLEGLGFELLEERHRVRVWQRLRAGALGRASLLLCAYRAVSVPTLMSLLELQKHGWRVKTMAGDGLISRARAILLSRWWAETADDVCLMVDDDIVFDPASADRLVALCRETRAIACAAYPVRDGHHLALRGLGGEIAFGPDEPPTRIRYGSTGCMAVHRRVVDALIPTLPLCHANQAASYWPLFQPIVIPDPPAGGHSYLSEDWAFCERAAGLGVEVWLDPTIRLGHLSQVELTVANMHAVHDALEVQRG